MKTKKRYISRLVLCLILVITISFTFAQNYIFACNSNSYDAYLNNKYSGKYLRNLNGALSESSGLLSTLGSIIKWKIVLVADDVYTICARDNTELYLTACDNALESTVYLDTLSNTVTSNQYKWRITAAIGGGCLIKNIHTGKYLCSINNAISSSSSLGAVGSVDYSQKVWRVARCNYYGNSNYHDRKELPYGYEFKTLYMSANESKIPELLDEYDNVLWSTADNFTFSGYDTNRVNVNNLTGVFTASTATSIYSTTITATHKVTRRTTSFNLVINPRSALIGVSNLGHDHYSALNDITSNLVSCGYSYMVYTGAFTSSDINLCLTSYPNNIFVSRSHGGADINEDGTQVGTFLLLNDVENDDANKVLYKSNESLATSDLTNMNLVIFIGCKTAAGGEYAPNLPSVAVARGAKTAIGFAGEIGCSAANSWTRDFFNLMENGFSVYDACSELASYSEYYSAGLDSFVICGNDNTRLN